MENQGNTSATMQNAKQDHDACQYSSFCLTCQQVKSWLANWLAGDVQILASPCSSTVGHCCANTEAGYLVVLAST